jgi:hypothetical protein
MFYFEDSKMLVNDLFALVPAVGSVRISQHLTYTRTEVASCDMPSRPWPLL